MKREIKFRAWNAERGRWSDGRDGYYGDMNVWEPVEFINYNLEDEDFIFEQYIGIDDEDGTPIYEGDIIRAQYYDGAQENNRCPAKVVWSDFYLCFVARFKDAREEDGNSYLPEEMPINAGNMEGVKVIGNIHENPELLEAK